MDAIEFLTSRTKLHEVYTSEISLSFCSSADHSGPKLTESLRSISTIASEIGFPYEIILVSSPGNTETRRVLSDISGTIGNLYIVKQRPRNRGNAYRLGYESSKGKYLVPFRSDVVYDIRYSDLIHTFLTKREKKLFLSELPVIHRDLVSEAGGYRDLSHGYDIDLFSRIAMMYGVVAYPALFNRIPLVSPPPFSDGDYGSARNDPSDHAKMRDHVISCNFDHNDLMKLYHGSDESISHFKSLYFRLIGAYAKVSRIKPFRFDRNNYLILMENLFESLVLRDFARYGMPDVKANMLLTREEISYLKSQSKVYRDVNYSISQYVLEV